MSTHSKDAASKQASSTSSNETLLKGRQSVDRSVRALMRDMEHENTLVQESPTGRLQRVLKIFRGVKPALVVISALPLIPSNWRAALVMFTQALDALSSIAPGFTLEFKAGKDLEV
jgi:hypothetical protein